MKNEETVSLDIPVETTKVIKEIAGVISNELGFRK
jgi:hypothetical protein